MEGENRYEQQQPPSDSNSQGEAEIKPEPNQKCPRCDSVKTKFCYFNNYKTSQPRYVCKDCKRFWTQGGNVRNILSKGGEMRMKRARESSSSGGSARTSPSTAVSSPPPPLTIVSAGGNARRVGTLNFTRPQPAANLPQLKFVRVDINSLSLTQGFNRVPNFCMASPQTQALTQGFNRFLNPYMTSLQAQVQSHPVQLNSQYHQASYGQGFAAHLKPSNHLGIPWWDPSCLNTAGASHYTEPGNENIFWDNSNQIGHSRGGLSGSSSSAWSAQLPGYGADAYLLL